jgi:hypothetical protein
MRILVVHDPDGKALVLRWFDDPAQQGRMHRLALKQALKKYPEYFMNKEDLYVVVYSLDAANGWPRSVGYL